MKNISTFLHLQGYIGRKKRVMLVTVPQWRLSNDLYFVLPRTCHHLHVCHSIHTAFALLIYTMVEYEQAGGQAFTSGQRCVFQVNPGTSDTLTRYMGGGWICSVCVCVCVLVCVAVLFTSPRITTWVYKVTTQMCGLCRLRPKHP